MHALHWIRVSVVIARKRIDSLKHAGKFFLKHFPRGRVFGFHPEPDHCQLSHQLFGGDSKLGGFSIELLGLFGAELDLNFLCGFSKLRHQIVSVHTKYAGQLKSCAQSWGGAACFVPGDLNEAYTCSFSQLFLR
nr:MAG TPA: hypothetical protein [Caudoviricetes sp.]DAH87077.1 MAG TPA: hypothetical protein [Caudoviricetes sp.]